VAGFVQHAVDDRLLDLRTEFRELAEVFPPRGERTGQVLHEMPDSPLTASEVEQEIGSHDAPTQPWSPADRGIRIGDIQHALLDEMNDLPIERGLETIGDVP